MITSHFTTKDIERFWSKVSIPDDPDACWEWQAAKRSKNGYGAFQFGTRKENNRKLLISHRVMYEMVFGEIPPSCIILHKCDNPGCCNPKHLSVGTHQDNMNDRNEKARQAKWERNGGGGKLTINIAREIRKRYSEGGILQRELAMNYGVDQTLISQIIRNAIWRE